MFVKRVALGGVIAHTVAGFYAKGSARFIKCAALVAEPENVFAVFAGDIMIGFSAEFAAEIIGKGRTVGKEDFAVFAVCQKKVCLI